MQARPLTSQTIISPSLLVSSPPCSTIDAFITRYLIQCDMRLSSLLCYPMAQRIFLYLRLYFSSFCNSLCARRPSIRDDQLIVYLAGRLVDGNFLDIFLAFSLSGAFSLPLATGRRTASRRIGAPGRPFLRLVRLSMYIGHHYLVMHRLFASADPRHRQIFQCLGCNRSFSAVPALVRIARN